MDHGGIGSRKIKAVIELLLNEPQASAHATCTREYEMGASPRVLTRRMCRRYLRNWGPEGRMGSSYVILDVGGLLSFLESILRLGENTDVTATTSPMGCLFPLLHIRRHDR